MIKLAFSLAARAHGLAWLLLALLVALPVAAEPLKQEGRETLYQRILTRPEAVLRSEPAAAALELERPAPFSVYYVFDRKEAEGKTWLSVGGAFGGPPLGWIEDSESVAWDQQLLLAFNNPAYRLRNLFFDTRDHAVDFFEHENLAQEAEKTIAAADAGALPAGSPVLAIEPKTFVDINENFYLLPILSAEDYFLNGMINAKLVQITSIPLRKGDDTPPRSLEDFNAAVVFVIDTTISMSPYIERTKQAIAGLSKQLADSPIGKHVSFGVVAFRGAATPGVDYVSKVFLEPVWPPDHSRFEAALADLKEATQSTKGFNEDGLAGMEAAINLPEWDQFGGRFIIYISDAGVHEGKDPLGSTGKNPSEINAIAREKQIATMVLHLKTPAGKAYSEGAERQYRLLSAWDGMGSLYFPIENGDVEAFGKAVDAATGQVLAIVDQSLGGGLLAGDPGATPATGDIGAATREVGRAMQLAYLGRGAAAPDLFQAWTLDRAMDNPLNPSFEVRVLLNRNQLNDLSQRLEALLKAGEDSQATSSADFFQLLRSSMAAFISDPARLASADQLGDFLNEYLEALPYRSQVLDIDEATWESSGAAWQEEILSGIRSKLATYKYLYGNTDLWTALYEGAPANELVYPVPLELLP